MKKRNLFGWFAMVAMVIGTSCSSDEVVNDYSADNAIQFGTYVGRDAQTRGSVLNNDLTNGLPTQGFGVFAYYTGTEPFSDTKHTDPNFMKNTKVTSTNATDWIYTPVKYWPNNTGDKVSFFAYAPHSSSYSLNGSNLTFTVNQTVKEQIDLTWNGSATKTTDMTKQTTTDKVKFEFKHALSKVGFKVQAATDEITVGSNVLDKNTVINVKRVILSATPVEYTAPSTYTTSSVFTKTATLNLNNFNTDVASWSDRKGDQYYTLTEENFKVKQLTNINSNLDNQLNADDSYLFILPQNLSSTGFNVFVEYEVVTTDPADGNPDSNTITNRINNTAKINFESGKAYTLNLVLGMTSVKLNVDIKDWQEQTETKVDLPLNK